MVLLIEESSGALDIGEGFRAGHLLPLEHYPRAERPFELRLSHLHDPRWRRVGLKAPHQQERTEIAKPTK
jgi:hypothetical protein